jgi:hypothetical protein
MLVDLNRTEIELLQDLLRERATDVQFSGVIRQEAQKLNERLLLAFRGCQMEAEVERIRTVLRRDVADS